MAARKEEHGPNQLAEQPPRAAWRVFTDQLRSGLFAILLLAVAMAALVGNVKDAAIIGLVVLLNATIGFTQQRKATRSLAALKQMLVPVAVVRREHALVTVSSVEVVPGDVVVLDTGARVPADGGLVTAHDVAVDQPSLTGESEPVPKSVVRLPADIPLADRANMLLGDDSCTGGVPAAERFGLPLDAAGSSR